MRTFPSIESKAAPMNITRLWSFLRRLALALMLAVPLAAAAAPQETFATPEAAVDALMAALKADSDPAMVAIFGEEHKDLLIHPIARQSSATRAKILAAMQTLRVLQRAEPGPPGAGDRRPGVADAHSHRAHRRPLALRHRRGRGRDRQSPHRRQRAQRHLRAARLHRRAARVCRARPRRRRRAPVRAEARQHAGQARRAVLARRRREGRRGEPVRAADRRELPPTSRVTSRATRIAAITSGS